MSQDNLLIQVGNGPGIIMNSPTTQRVASGDGAGTGSPVVGSNVQSGIYTSYNMPSPVVRTGSGGMQDALSPSAARATLSPGVVNVPGVESYNNPNITKSNEQPKLISLGDDAGSAAHAAASRNAISSPSAMNPLSELSTIFSHSGTPNVEHLGLPHVPPTPSNSESIPFASYGIDFNQHSHSHPHPHSQVTATPPNSQNLNSIALANALNNNTASQLSHVFGHTSTPTPPNSTSGGVAIGVNPTPPVSRPSLVIPPQDSTTPRLDFSNPVAPTPPNSGRVMMHPAPVETTSHSKGSGISKGLDLAHLQAKLEHVVEEKEHQREDEKKDVGLDLWLVDLGTENEKLGSSIGELLRAHNYAINKRLKERVGGLSEKNQDLRRRLEESNKRVQQLEAENQEMANKVKTAESQCEFFRMKTEQLEKRTAEKEEKEKSTGNNLGIMDLAKNILKKGS